MSPETLSKFIDKQLTAHPIEARITRKVIRSLENAGTPVTAVWDNETTTPARTEREILELVFNLDEAYLMTDDRSWVRIALGNKWYALVDHTIDLEAALEPVNRLIQANI